jgi:hypothetical protein
MATERHFAMGRKASAAQHADREARILRSDQEHAGTDSAHRARVGGRGGISGRRIGAAEAISGESRIGNDHPRGAHLLLPP